MFGQATLDIPRNGDIGPSRIDNLSDEVAMTLGRMAAWTLSDEKQFVAVTLESGETRVIGQDTVTGTLTIGRLSHGYRVYT